MFDPKLTFGFALYLAAIAVIGARAYRHTRDAGDFILGGRRLPYWITALSAGASDMSGWLLLGLPGLAYAAAAEAAWVASGLLLGTYLNWRFIARPLRRATAAANDALTLPEFFAHRFDDRSRTLRRVAAVLILVFFVFYTAAGFVAGGKLFAAAFGIPYPFAVLAGALLVLSYTVFGGFLAVAWTDALQATLMLLALLVVVALCYGPVADIASVNVALRAATATQPVSALVIVSALAWGLGYAGQPHILMRFMAIRHASEIGRARRVAVAWTGAGLVAAVLVGIGGHLVLDTAILAGDRETVFIHLVRLLLHPAVAGVCLAAILAAIMSTADSQLLVAAAAFTHDLKPATGARALARHRAAVVVVSVIAVILALNPNARVLDLVAYAWGGFGAGLGPTVIMALYSRRTDAMSALAGIVAGSATMATWEFADGGMFDVYALLPGFCAGLATIHVANHIRSPGAARR